MDYVLIIVSIFGFCCVFLLGFGSCLVYFWLVERQALSLVRKQAQEKGAVAKVEQSERLMSFMLEVKTAFDAAKDKGIDAKTFATTELPAIALKYPDVVLKFGKKLSKMAGIEGLDGFGKGLIAS